MRELIEERWPELVHKLPPKKPQGPRWQRSPPGTSTASEAADIAPSLGTMSRFKAADMRRERPHRSRAAKHRDERAPSAERLRQGGYLLSLFSLAASDPRGLREWPGWKERVAALLLPPRKYLLSSPLNGTCEQAFA
jgi:hypothetical protein